MSMSPGMSSSKWNKLMKTKSDTMKINKMYSKNKLMILKRKSTNSKIYLKKAKPDNLYLLIIPNNFNNNLITSKQKADGGTPLLKNNSISDLQDLLTTSMEI